MSLTPGPDHELISALFVGGPEDGRWHRVGPKVRTIIFTEDGRFVRAFDAPLSPRPFPPGTVFYKRFHVDTPGIPGTAITAPIFALDMLHDDVVMESAMRMLRRRLEGEQPEP